MFINLISLKLEAIYLYLIFDFIKKIKNQNVFHSLFAGYC